MTIDQFLMFLNGTDDPKQIAAILSASENFFLTMVLESELEGRGKSLITTTGLDHLTIMQPGNDMLQAGQPVTKPFNSYVLKTTRMSPAIRLDALPSITLKLDDDTPVMVTTQLNGCTLVFQRSSLVFPYVKIVHLMPETPKQPNAGEQLNRQLLDANPRFAGEDATTAMFGRLNTGDRAANANIIALRRKRQWTLYAQLVGANQTVIGVQYLPMYTPTA